MFTDVTTAHRHVFSLSRSLMVATSVIAIERKFGAITAEDTDGSTSIVTEYDGDC